jgi:uncharacterized membrane protein YkoI
MRKAVSTLCLAPALLGATLAIAPAAARADDDGGDGSNIRTPREEEQEDHDAILDAVRRGAILPLPKLREGVLSRWPGDLVAVSVDRDDGRIRYEFRILRSDGRLTEVEVDAADGTVLEVENE